MLARRNAGSERSRAATSCSRAVTFCAFGGFVVLPLLGIGTLDYVRSRRGLESLLTRQTSAILARSLADVRGRAERQESDLALLADNAETQHWLERVAVAHSARRGAHDGAARHRDGSARKGTLSRRWTAPPLRKDLLAGSCPIRSSRTTDALTLSCVRGLLIGTGDPIMCDTSLGTARDHFLLSVTRT